MFILHPLLDNAACTARPAHRDWALQPERIRTRGLLALVAILIKVDTRPVRFIPITHPYRSAPDWIAAKGLAHSPVDMRRYAIRATQNCLLINPFALLLLPFAASGFSQVL
jgi:hypothetical protein